MSDVMRKATCAVSVDETAEGYYCVSTYATGDPGVQAQTQMYRHLSWVEALDVVLVTFDEYHPGQTRAVQAVQSMLW